MRKDTLKICDWLYVRNFIIYFREPKMSSEATIEPEMLEAAYRHGGKEGVEYVLKSEPEWVKELPKLTFYNSLMEVEKEALKRFIEIVINNLK